jgi:hypothetical protein
MKFENIVLQADKSTYINNKILTTLKKELY